MGQTSNPTLRYPEGTNRPQVAVHLKQLAEDTKAAFDADRAAINAIGNYQTYTPSWQGPTALSIGNGSIAGRYVKIGRLVSGHIHLTRGSTTHVGAGAYTFSLPVNSIAWPAVSGIGYVRVSGGSSGHGLTTLGIGPGSVGIAYTMDGTRVGYNNRPGGSAWAAGDEFVIGFQYIAGA